jgi:hypothetical protein
MVTNFKEQRPSSGGNSRSASQDIPRLYEARRFNTEVYIEASCCGFD